ncbi:hypothetical protein [Brevundimonas nasdae]|uniref:Uncharacterized protein n=1 Tax=Brevundimonas nasdae TaxID=172043 RepID=A0ABX8TEW5_9CAUL|nr:hypothetical protein [Brevundimonas nasdae]QYC09727.1 hypothetical protein KWG56_14250 [Brevundimonas nasdae]QYC12515.1 hypothetical protein KWG63_09570 [Brevundimonas nasdae]
MKSVIVPSVQSPPSMLKLHDFCNRAHQCNTENLPTSLRCIQCGANLVGTSISSPTEFKKKHAQHDAVFLGRLYALGFSLAFLFIAFVVIPNIGSNPPLVVAGTWACGLIGRAIGRKSSGL